MALTPSSMVELGFQAHDFSLPDVFSKAHKSLQDVAGSKGLLVMFICNHCPYVVHIEEALVALGKEFHGTDLGIVAISANDINDYPQDCPELMAEKQYGFPYLYDETQEVARAYRAECTPDFFLFDGGLKCVYRGQFDDSRPGNGKPVTGKDLRTAMTSLLKGEPVSEDQKPSIGCNIKWRV
ncbi:thioredoxin family protein [Endozoicomonas elysicola]|uniref:Alkyl hydroperoxide reductase n=1 Tax=Endozoicomonas elysicola TaxID=305900 RepID=A0A081KFL2_9GAMM|nr:thioredoxin family protein [Endozoicomonas elysicola]KEI72938.1 alkyl hydroperoxide reductase [Endozoicomonas elysicola]